MVPNFLNFTSSLLMLFFVQPKSGNSAERCNLYIHTGFWSKFCLLCWTGPCWQAMWRKVTQIFEIRVVFSVRFERWKVDKKQTYTKTEAYKLYSRILWIYLPNVIKINPCNFELYLFKVGAFFETQYILWYCYLLISTKVWRNMRANFSDQELISYRYSSYSICSCSSCCGDLFKKFKAPWKQICLEWNLAEMSIFTQYPSTDGVIIYKWRPWRHFMQVSAATWWVKTKRLPRA